MTELLPIKENVLGNLILSHNKQYVDIILISGNVLVKYNKNTKTIKIPTTLLSDAIHEVIDIQLQVLGETISADNFFLEGSTLVITFTTSKNILYVAIKYYGATKNKYGQLAQGQNNVDCLKLVAVDRYGESHIIKKVVQCDEEGNVRYISRRLSQLDTETTSKFITVLTGPAQCNIPEDFNCYLTNTGQLFTFKTKFTYYRSNNHTQNVNIVKNTAMYNGVPYGWQLYIDSTNRLNFQILNRNNTNTTITWRPVLVDKSQEYIGLTSLTSSQSTTYTLGATWHDLILQSFIVNNRQFITLNLDGNLVNGSNDNFSTTTINIPVATNNCIINNVSQNKLLRFGDFDGATPNVAFAKNITMSGSSYNSTTRRLEMHKFSVALSNISSNIIWSRDA